MASDTIRGFVSLSLHLANVSPASRDTKTPAFVAANTVRSMGETASEVTWPTSGPASSDSQLGPPSPRRTSCALRIGRRTRRPRPIRTPCSTGWLDDAESASRTAPVDGSTSRRDQPRRLSQHHNVSSTLVMLASRMAPPRATASATIRDSWTGRRRSRQVVPSSSDTTRWPSSNAAAIMLDPAATILAEPALVVERRHVLAQSWLTYTPWPVAAQTPLAVATRL